MRIIEVIPISRAIGRETLSYFTPDDVHPGAIVRVPLRRRQVFGIVVSEKGIAEEKARLKSSPFVVRKAERLAARQFLAPAFMWAAGKAADFYSSTTGSVLSSLVARPVLEYAVRHDKFASEPASGTWLSSGGTQHEPEALQTDREERFDRYRGIIRETFARGRSVFFCLPSVEDVTGAAALLSKGIEGYTRVFHGSLSKKKIFAELDKLVAESHPVLIIATGGFLCLPRPDLGAIIVEAEGSRGYKLQSRPFLDLRQFAEFLAQSLSARFIMGDSLLRVETIWREKRGDVAAILPLSFRFGSEAQTELIDMRAIPGGSKKRFSALSPAALELITEARSRGERLFLFSSRRGLSSETVCRDCGNVVLCGRCRFPTVLHGASPAKGNFFLCHKCGESRPASERCAICQSWNLLPLGVGSERVEQELAEKFPDAPLFRVDADAPIPPREISELIARFFSVAGGILVGTERALFYLNRKIENSIVVSMDSFLALPDFRISERAMRILLKLRELTEKRLIVQTRNAGHGFFKQGLSGNLAEFYREEIGLRDRFKYPPFSVLIKLTVSGGKETAKRESDAVAADFLKYQPIRFPVFGSRGGGVYATNLLLKIPKGEENDPVLREKLRSLPPSVTIAIEPDTII